MAYDAAGNTRSLTDPVGNTTTWSYDALDRVTTRTDPTNTSATFAYDAASQLRSATDRLGRRVDYGYDGVGRLASEVWLTSGATVQLQTWTYDAAGRMLTAQDPDGVYTLGYDTADRVTSVHEPFGAALTFAYDGVGNRTGVQDSGGGVTTVTFDALNRQTEEEFGGSGLTKLKESRTYTAAGEVSLVTRQAWVSAAWSTAGTTSYAYDSNSQVTKITHFGSGGSVLASYVYAYDGAGRLSSEVLNGASRTYSYDATGQLTADGATGYSYDGTGNRTNAGYVTGAGNRTTSDGTWTYTYDAEGNVTKRSKGASSDTWVYTYDHRNQLVSSAYSATDGGAVTQRVTNSYDAWGNKVQRQAWDGSTTATERYAVDGWDPAKDWAIGVENFDTWADLNGSNAITMRRGYGPGFDELGWRQTSGGTVGWYLTDRLGSVRGVTSGTGTPLTTLTYSGWGAVLSNSTPAQSDAYGFTGRPTDPATGLRDHRTRVTAGNQWLQEDGLGLAPDVNPRRYVGNSPTNYTDPSGYQEGVAPYRPPGRGGVRITPPAQLNMNAQLGLNGRIDPDLFSRDDLARIRREVQGGQIRPAAPDTISEQEQAFREWVGSFPPSAVHRQEEAFFKHPLVQFGAGVMIGVVTSPLTVFNIVDDLRTLIDKLENPGPAAQVGPGGIVWPVEREPDPLMLGYGLGQSVGTGAIVGGTFSGLFRLGKWGLNRLFPEVESPAAVPEVPKPPAKAPPDPAGPGSTAPTPTVPKPPKVVPHEANPIIDLGSLQSHRGPGDGPQKGPLSRSGIDEKKAAMLDGTLYNDPLDKAISGWIEGRKLTVSDGHHRVQAAIELYHETGNAYYINQLIRSSSTPTVRPSPWPGVAPIVEPSPLVEASPPPGAGRFPRAEPRK